MGLVKLLLEALLGLGFLGAAFKWLFSSRFRLELAKKNFEKDKLDLDNNLDLCLKNSENLLQLVQF